jgi:hypothetical protein
MMKHFLLIAAAVTSLAACSNDAQVASSNLSKAADNFEIRRRIVFYNGIPGEYMLVLEGLCSQEPLGGRLAVTCKTGPTAFKKHFLGLSNNVTYFSEQVEAANTDVYHYRVTFKPAAIVPAFDYRN